jgi:hypothetical protein
MEMTFQPDPKVEALDRELQRGERVLWKGEGIPRFQASAMGIWFFAIPWTAFAVFWTVMAAGGMSQSWDDVGWIGLAFPAFGLPFIIVGIGMLSMPFLSLFGAKNMLWVVTNQRLIRLYVGRKLRVSSIPGEQIGQTERSERPDGSGTVRIELNGPRRRRRGSSYQFGEVANVRMAEQRIRELARYAQREEEREEERKSGRGSINSSASSLT